MNADALIRAATPADVPAVLPMVAQICALHEAWDAAKYGFLPDPAQRYQQWLIEQAHDPHSVFWVAELPESGQLVAFLVATIEPEIPIYHLPEFGFVHDLWVEPAYRQAGIARQLVAQTMKCFEQLGVRQIRLDTAIANEAARRVFQACGFRPSTVEMLVDLGGEVGR